VLSGLLGLCWSVISQLTRDSRRYAHDTRAVITLIRHIGERQLLSDQLPPLRGVVGRGRRRYGVPPLLSTRPPLPPTFSGLKFVQKLVHCCNWLLTETQCKIISVQHVRRPKTFKNLCLSLVSGVPHFFLSTTPLHPLSSMRTPIAHLLSYTALLQTVSLELTRLETIVHNFPDVNRFSTFLYR